MSEDDYVEIFKRFNVSAAHKLNLPYESKCNNLHGHNWTVEVRVSATLNEQGMVIDFNHLKKIIMRLDHTFLNEIFGSVLQTTAENIARFYAYAIVLHVGADKIEHVMVSVAETPGTEAVFACPGEHEVPNHIADLLKKVYP